MRSITSRNFSPFIYTAIRMRLFILFLSSLLILQSCGTGQEESTPPEAGTPDQSLLWKVSGNGLSAPSYLFGTMHIICKEKFSLSDNLKAKVKASEKIVLELDLDDPELMLKYLGGTDMPDSTIRDLLTAEQYQQIETYFKDSLGISLDSKFGKMKPFFLASMMYPEFLNCTMESYEQAFQDMAQEQEKEILGLETVEEQLEIFDIIPYRLQADMLYRMVSKYDSSLQEMNVLVASYMTQNVDSIARMTENGRAGFGKEYDTILLQNRNKKWIAKIEALMKKGATFFGVGAAHLGGEDGVINLLEQKGYSLTPLPN